MSLVLCIETSADPGMIGLVHDGSVIADEVLVVRDQLADRVEQMLVNKLFVPADLNSIAVGIGPGSFTGLRVGLSFSKGMAFGLRIPILPVPSLQVFAANLHHKAAVIGVISPARKNEAHFAVFDGELLEPLEDPAVVPYETLPDMLPEDALLIGPGIEKLPDHLKIVLSGRIPNDLLLHRAHAHELAELAKTLWTDREPPDAASLVPTYGLDFPS